MSPVNKPRPKKRKQVRPKGKKKLMLDKRTRKKRRSKNRKDALTMLNLKVSEKDRRALNAAAKKYANGNLSAWLRFAGAAFRPGKYRLIT